MYVILPTEYSVFDLLGAKEKSCDFHINEFPIGYYQRTEPVIAFYLLSIQTLLHTAADSNNNHKVNIYERNDLDTYCTEFIFKV